MVIAQSLCGSTALREIKIMRQPFAALRLCEKKKSRASHLHNPFDYV